jgi:UDP-N-acetylglucosamine diphosphorylase / glucose-1-phosphate thymidylyltransferase / UDP-N-acetylgalactosamine diphosphorylase / glucosamine-1-phosphate N-acetyltransferase / galactosamine-1-phosphate N-acetyltransferase
MVQAVILAAGESSRFKPLSDSHHKSLTKICGKELIRHTVESAFAGGVEEVIVVHSPEQDKDFKNILASIERVKFVVQPEPKGMGDAVKCAAPFLRGEFFVLNADRYDAAKYVEPMIAKMKGSGAKMILLCNPTDKTWKYGIAGFHSQVNDRVVSVTEKPKKGEEQSNYRIVGVYLLPADFLSYYDAVEEHQYAFEDALDAYAKKNNVRAVFTDNEVSSTKYAFDLLDVAKGLLSMQKSYISPTAKIAKNVTIEDNVFIGDGARIFENAVIKGPAYIGRNTVVGNNALVRENSVIEDSVQIGMNSEIARSVFLEGAHIHSGFVGDSVVGKNVRLGANFITANRRVDRANVKFIAKGEMTDSGKSFLGCVIGHNSKTGINASAMPGAIIGSDCLVGPHTMIKGSVASGTTIYAEFNTIVKKKENAAD